MNEADLKGLSAKELVSMATDLKINAKGKNSAVLIPLILGALNGDPVEDEGEGEVTETTLTPEQIKAQEKDLMNGEDEAIDYDTMSEEQVLEAQLAAAEHPAVIQALGNALDALRAGPVEQAAPQPHVATQGVSMRPVKAGSHYPTPSEVRELLSGHVKRGLKIVKIDDKAWHFQHGVKECAGTMKMPVRTVLQQASLLMRPTGKPTEDLSYDELLAEKVAQKARR